jgi:uncharacterized tellurite resistance protein B-like protein
MKRILSILQGSPKDQPAPVDELQLAVAALLIEAACMDGDFGAEERETIRALLTEQFDLEAGEAEALLDEGEREIERAGELWRFARTIKDRYDEAERIHMLEMLWEVAYSDGVLHDFEANLLRRITGLLYVPDQESGAARRRVRERLGLADD